MFPAIIIRLGVRLVALSLPCFMYFVVLTSIAFPSAVLFLMSVSYVDQLTNELETVRINWEERYNMLMREHQDRSVLYGHYGDHLNEIKSS